MAYDVFLGPLSHVPGSKFAAASHLPKVISLWTGSDVHDILALHEKYGPVVRTAPRQVSYTDASAWKVIYGHRTGGKTKTFEKDPRFYLADPATVRHIVIADDPNHTRQRRILANSFSDKVGNFERFYKRCILSLCQALRDQEPLLKRWAGYMVSKLKEATATGEAVNMVAYYNFTT